MRARPAVLRGGPPRRVRRVRPPCGPNLARRAGDDVYAGNTEYGCPKDHRVLNGACVACDPGVFRAPGDVPSFGDTECECKCKGADARVGVHDVRLNDARGEWTARIGDAE